jgi:hypothetical protein
MFHGPILPGGLTWPETAGLSTRLGGHSAGCGTRLAAAHDFTPFDHDRRRFVPIPWSEHVKCAVGGAVGGAVSGAVGGGGAAYAVGAGMSVAAVILTA